MATEYAPSVNSDQYLRMEAVSKLVTIVEIGMLLQELELAAMMDMNYKMEFVLHLLRIQFNAIIGKYQKMEAVLMLVINVKHGTSLKETV